MCQKMTVFILTYIAIIVATVKCDEGLSSPTNIMDYLSKDLNVGRTFGHNALKRLSFIFLPVMFTLGVISTLLMALAVISVKNLAIGVMLLIVAVSQAVSRLLFAASAPLPQPLLFHPRAELLPAPLPAAPWPAPAPVLSPWGRSDNDGPTLSD